MNQEIALRDREEMSVAAKYRKMSTKALYDEIRKLVDVTADHIRRMAMVAHELERRGEDVVALRSGIGFYLRAVHTKRLLPEAVVKLAGNKTALAAIAQMPLDIQRGILELGTVAIKTEAGAQDVKVHLLTKAHIAQAFDAINGVLLPPNEQKLPSYRQSAEMPRDEPITLYLNRSEYMAIRDHAERCKRTIKVLIIQTLRDNGLLA